MPFVAVPLVSTPGLLSAAGVGEAPSGGKPWPLEVLGEVDAGGVPARAPGANDCVFHAGRLIKIKICGV